MEKKRYACSTEDAQHVDVQINSIFIYKNMDIYVILNQT